MNFKNPIVRELLLVTVGEILCVAVMLAVFALLGYLDHAAVLGGILGGALAAGNFALTAVGVLIASRKAADQDVRGAQGSMMSSMTIRYLAMLVILVIAAKSGRFNVLALVLPLLFIRPLLTVCELFRKKDDAV